MQEEPADGRLSRARFANEAERFARSDRKADAVDGSDVGDVTRRQTGMNGKIFVEISDLDEDAIVHRVGTIGSACVCAGR